MNRYLIPLLLLAATVVAASPCQTPIIVHTGVAFSLTEGQIAFLPSLDGGIYTIKADIPLGFDVRLSDCEAGELLASGSITFEVPLSGGSVFLIPSAPYDGAVTISVYPVFDPGEVPR